ncbi:MAG TPA: hypothetical protein VFC63_05650 [Blastocatellia bacterium]|nr:hypothetical protein [Blastocatellia bacterium]
MWNRTKRLVNSYLDNLIDKVEKPDQQVQDAGTVKASQLGASAVESLANVKMFEKRITETEAKIATLESRIPLLSNDTQRMIMQSQLDTSRAELLDLQQRLTQARGSAIQAQKAMKEHPGQVRETMNNARLAQMGETLAGTSMPTKADDPFWVMDEMKSKIEQRSAVSSAQTADARIAAADAELEKPESVVDDLLSQYKRDVASERVSPPVNQTVSPPKVAESKAQPEPKEETATGGKSLASADEIKSLD